MDLKKIKRAAQDQAWVIETRNGKVYWRPPGKTKREVRQPNTVHDQRALKNFLAELKRQGLLWPPERRTHDKEEVERTR
ncbi:MAG: hypothetical protein QOK05_510 [Chloroflexota bacterium]|jgi:hypothetical protein|nr:hypothetical protein [Chloroflexota bacterium]